MKRVILFLFILLLVAMMAAQVNNADKPLKGKWNLQLKKVWQVAEAGPDSFAEIRAVRIGADGRVIVQDRKNFKIFLFDGEGKFIKSFSKRGEGPGEIKQMRGLQVIEDKIVAMDAGRVHFFDENGKFITTKVTPTNLTARAFITADTFISAPLILRRGKKDPEKIVVYDLVNQSEKIITQYMPFRKAVTSKTSGGNTMVVAVLVSGITPMMIVQYHKGIIYYGMSNSYEINMVDLNGKKLGSFSLKGRKLHMVSMEFKKNLFSRGGNIPPDMLNRLIKGLPDEASFFSRIEVDKNGLIYVAVPNPELRHVQEIDIFSAKGKYLYSTEIRLNEGDDIKGIAFANDVVIIAHENEDGDILVGKYTVKLPQN